MLSRLGEAWNAYVAAEERGLRREYLPALDVFLRSWAASTPDVRATWVSEFIEHWTTGKEKPPFRGPLLEQAVLPHLVAEFRAGSARAALLLAELRESPLGSHRCWDEMEMPTGLELLAEAYRRDPSSEMARRRLVEKRLHYVRYTLHELPHGVLFGVDGATVAECADLERFLDEVRESMVESELAEHDALLSEAQFHYRTYQEYLQQADRCGYEAYARGHAANNRLHRTS